MNAVLYARVSTDDQSERGTIEEQIEFGQKYAELHQMNLVKIYKDDGISGTYELQERKPIPNLGKSEADIVRMMYHLIGNKGCSAWEVAGVLNAMGVPTSYVLNDRKVKKGKRKEKTAGIWRSSRVRNMIYNTVYKGIHYYGKRTTRKRELIPREVPAIVSEELWEKAVQRIKDNKILANKNHKEENLLRGLIKCGVCGRRYYAVYYRNNGRTPTYYYVCSGKVGDQARFSSSRCTSKNVPKEWLENLVWNDIVSFSHNPDTVIRDIVNDLNSQIEGSRKQNIQFEKEMLQKTIESKENEKQAILDLFRKRLISNQDVELQIQKINNEKEELIQRLQTLEQDLTSIQDIQNRLSTTDSVLREVRKKLKEN